VAEFPINDGGLFYRMTETLVENNFFLPKYVQYNGLSIPLAYPPLGFYLAGTISQLFRIELIPVFTFLPAIILIIILVAFFALADRLFESKLRAGLATLIFALLPRSITWSIMGGGITRSFGQLFLLLAVLNIYQLFSLGTKKYLLLSILFSALVCLSHPEAALHTLGIVLLIMAFKVRSIRGFYQATIVAGGTILLTSIWWLPIVLRFGITPYVSAAQTGLHSAKALLYLFISFSEEPFLTLIAVLGILGLAAQIAERKFFLPTWYIIPFIIEPRNATNVAVIPMAMLASTALIDVTYPSLAQIESRTRKTEFGHVLQGWAAKFLTVYLALIMVFGIYFYSISLIEKKVSFENRTAFNWITTNTPPDSRFLIITGNLDLVSDWTIEWFPALTDRINETTIQGLEWIDGRQFLPRVHQIQAIQNCVNASPSLQCVESYAKELGAQYDYLYIAKKTAPKDYAATIRGDTLIRELMQANDRFKMVYQTDEVVIFMVWRSP
jgi:hypothetical protein